MEKEGEIRQKMCTLIMDAAGERIEHKQRWERNKQRQWEMGTSTCSDPKNQEQPRAAGTGPGVDGESQEHGVTGSRAPPP